MNKRGQFFLIAAVIIAGIILTLGAINISTKKVIKDEKSFYDLSKEISYESNQLIDHGVYTGQSDKINDSLISFVEEYSAINPGTDMLLIYGNLESSPTVILYSWTSSGTSGVSGGGPTLGVPQMIPIQTNPESTFDKEEGIVTVKLSEELSLTFELKQGENFYIVLKKQSGGETLVAQQ